MLAMVHLFIHASIALFTSHFKCESLFVICGIELLTD